MKFQRKIRYELLLVLIVITQQLVMHVYLTRHDNDARRSMNVTAQPACNGNTERKHGQLLHDRLTVVMATSPRPAGHCILHIRSTLRSLYHWLPELRLVTLRIAFDGCPDGNPLFWEAAWCIDYQWQKNAIHELVDAEFSNATIVFDAVAPETSRAGLGGNLRNAFRSVVTPYSYVIQDDFVHSAHFDMHEVLDTLEANPAIEYIRLNVLRNGERGLWDHASDEVVLGNGVQCVKKGLTRGCNWGDNNHVVPTQAYRDMLHAMPNPAKAPESNFEHTRAACAKQMKWYLYGALGHSPMICHVDGMYRAWNNGKNNNRKRQCPTEEQYRVYLAQQCPTSGLAGGVRLHAGHA